MSSPLIDAARDIAEALHGEVDVPEGCALIVIVVSEDGRFSWISQVSTAALLDVAQKLVQRYST